MELKGRDRKGELERGRTRFIIRRSSYGRISSAEITRRTVSGGSVQAGLVAEVTRIAAQAFRLGLELLRGPVGSRRTRLSGVGSLWAVVADRRNRKSNVRMHRTDLRITFQGKQ